MQILFGSNCAVRFTRLTLCPAPGDYPLTSSSTHRLTDRLTNMPLYKLWFHVISKLTSIVSTHTINVVACKLALRLKTQSNGATSPTECNVIITQAISSHGLVAGHRLPQRMWHHCIAAAHTTNSSWEKTANSVGIQFELDYLGLDH